jgi:hypothetical protein
MKFKFIIPTIMLFLFFAIGVVSAADLKITDINGTVVDVLNARIDYTNYSFIYTLDFESSGIRVYQGEGKVTISWSRISSLTVLQKKSDTIPDRLIADITFKDGKKSTMELVMESKKGLAGETQLGEFSIDLEKIKTIEVLKAG